MKIDGDYAFKLPIQVVWDGIFDPEILAASLPGCESLEREGDVMRGELVIKIGPVKGKFKGTVELSDLDEPNGCKLSIDGRGAQGFVKATADIALAESDGQTVLTYSSDSKVGGKLASVGQRLIGASARAIAKQSLEALDATLTEVARAAPDPEPEAEPEADDEPEIETEDDLDGGEPSSRDAAIARARAGRKSQAAFARGVAAEVARDVIPGWLRVALIFAAGVGAGVVICALTH
jgi:carbon monoxide dehydrogenase subunit G